MIRIAACSYEGSLFGWKVTPNSEFSGNVNSIAGVPTVHHKKKDKKKRTATATNSHSAEEAIVELQFGLHISHGSFKAIAVSRSGKYLAVAGMTERIYLYTMIDNKEIGEIFGHTGAITSLSFYEDSFLISGSEDFTLNVWRVHDRQLLQILGGHKDIVYSFSIHPTGKIALSVSKDHTLKLWNLVQGRCSFTRRLRSTAEYVMWNPEGNYYLLATQREIQVFDVNNNNDCKLEIKGASRINHVAFIIPVINHPEDLRIACICENNTISIYNMSGLLTCNLNLTSVNVGRLRTLSTCAIPRITEIEPIQNGLVIATSNGCVMILNAASLERAYIEEPENTINDADENNDNNPPLSRDESIFSKALYAFHQLRADPRLTAVSAWLVTETSNNYVKDDTEVFKPTIENNLAESEAQIAEDIEEEEDAIHEQKKRKQKKVGFSSDLKKKKIKKSD